MTAANPNGNGSHDSSSTINTHIDKRDFDENRALLHPVPSSSSKPRSLSSRASSVRPRSLIDERDGLMGTVADELLERDRRRMGREVVRVGSFVWAVFCCLCAGSISAFSLYAPLFLSRLHYTQLRINTVAIAAELAQYLPVPIFGFLSDRYGPPVVSFLSAIVFGYGYLLAAFTYRSGAPADAVAGGEGWPFWVMVVAFVGIGSGTTSLYIAAVSTCVKNFGRGKRKGIVLAVPITAVGLSGMWQSQVGARLLYEPLPDGGRGDVDVFRYFVFLAVLLMVAGFGGVLALRVVDEEELIEEAVEELERSGLLEESEFFRNSTYGTLGEGGDVDSEDEETLSEEERAARRREEEEERRRKTWLLNQETSRFLKDPTAWWIAAGVLLGIGPGEAFINNLGTIIHTLTPPNTPPTTSPPAGLPSTHVTIFAITSTLARLLLGTLSDIFAPSPNPSTNKSLTIPRPLLLITSSILLSLSFLLLATSLPQIHPPLFAAVSALVGLGYGATFSLVPILISVVWGVENFGTNWGIVAMVPALGAAVAGLAYSVGYDGAVAGGGDAGTEGSCYGWSCYGWWSVACTVAVWAAIACWGMAWRGWRKRGVIV